jgi:hypothetical protein
MKTRPARNLVWGALAAAGALAAIAPSVRAAAETTRTVYISAVDAKGASVTNLTPADIVVRENGQVRAVTHLVLATEPSHVAVLVDDGGSGTLQAPVARLLAAGAGRAAFSISILNPQPFRLNDYTTEFEVLRTAIGKIVERGRTQQDGIQLIEAVSWAAKDLQKRKLSRPVIVALTNGGEPEVSDVANYILTDLRESGAALHLVYVGGVPMGKVLVDGPTLSGGSSTLANGTQAFFTALNAVAGTLASQYRLTYVLPDGVKAHERLQVTTTRPDVKIVAPTRIPNK